MEQESLYPSSPEDIVKLVQQIADKQMDALWTTAMAVDFQHVKDIISGHDDGGYKQLETI